MPDPMEGVFETLPKSRMGLIAWFLAWTFGILLLGIFIGRESPNVCASP